MALSWYQRALDGREMALGKDQPDTLGTVNNMARVSQEKEEHDNALSWYQRALDGQETALGKDHPYTLATVNTMALIFEVRANTTRPWSGIDVLLMAGRWPLEKTTLALPGQSTIWPENFRIRECTAMPCHGSTCSRWPGGSPWKGPP